MPRAKRNRYKTMSLEGLEHVPNLSGEWTWQTPSTYKWDTYKLRESDTEKSHTIIYMQVNYSRRANGDWQEDQRYKTYRRLTKYLAINGPLEGQWITTKTPDYTLYYTQYGSSSTLPRKVMIHTDSMARKLGLLW